MFSVDDDTEDALIVTEYCNLARFATQAIGGAMGYAIRRNAVRRYGQNYFERHGRLPSGHHRVGFAYQQSKGSFDAEFPDRELADAAVLAIVRSRSGIHRLLGSRLLGEIVPSLRFEQVKRIEIRDDWVGFANPPYVRRHWSLVRPGIGLRAGVQETRGCREATWEGAAIARSVKLFVELLQRLSLHEAHYVPFIDHTDDYPSMTMRLELEEGELTVGSQSQGRHRVPWYVDTGGLRYFANCAIPSLAFTILQPMLCLATRSPSRSEGPECQ